MSEKLGSILDALLNGEDISVPIEKAAAASSAKTVTLSASGYNMTRDVLDDYDLGAALDAIATNHHARAVKFASAIISALDAAMQPNARRTELDGALEAIVPYIVKARAERKQCVRFEGASLRVGKGVETARVFDRVASDAAKAALDTSPAVAAE